MLVVGAWADMLGWNEALNVVRDHLQRMHEQEMQTAVSTHATHEEEAQQTQSSHSLYDLFV